MPLVIVADITATPGAEAQLQAALRKLVAPTRAEAGCLTYDLHTDNDRPDHFLFYEVWESRAAWLAHMQSPHIVANGTATKGLVAASSLYEMSVVGT